MLRENSSRKILINEKCEKKKNERTRLTARAYFFFAAFFFLAAFLATSLTSGF
jgi:hypothetical protein